MLEDTKAAIKQRSKAGYYDADTQNLADEVYYRGSSYTQERMEAILTNEIKKFFEPLGYKVLGDSNILTITWGTKEQIAEAHKLLDSTD